MIKTRMFGCERLVCKAISDAEDDVLRFSCSGGFPGQFTAAESVPGCSSEKHSQGAHYAETQQ